MARNLVLVVAIVATLLHGSAATSHVVGDSTGWTIPSGGASTYTSWASKQTFKQGDTLVFNFANGQHDVAKVTKSAYDACNGTNAITTVTTSPATITLNQTGEHYFICAFTGHCAAGQKLAVNVTKASSPSPAPQPSSSPKAASPTPAPKSSSPAPTPASAPASAPVTYTVGGSSGWIIPTNGGASFYTSWASGKTFKVGDILVFNFAKNQHNVEEVTKNNYDACGTSSPIATYNASPVRVTLNKTGEHYFICGFSGHCAAGQKLAINVTGGTGSTPSSPSPSPSPSGSETPSPGSSPSNPSSPSPAGSSGGSTSPPPKDSGASSLKAFGFSATLISLVAAAFFC
ncbi:blue copper protein-like [Arachis stenosperma]|uniref:blue copper protein-like n=1 Tax=Arachis stenosperma TaxID=217475 RepID=UPI0025ABA0C7|nr:blue copper protein-like [Arachis stenosperma]